MCPVRRRGRGSVVTEDDDVADPEVALEPESANLDVGSACAVFRPHADSNTRATAAASATARSVLASAARRTQSISNDIDYK